VSGLFSRRTAGRGSLAAVQAVGSALLVRQVHPGKEQYQMRRKNFPFLSTKKLTSCKNALLRPFSALTVLFLLLFFLSINVKKLPQSKRTRQLDAPEFLFC